MQVDIVALVRGVIERLASSRAQVGGAVGLSVPESAWGCWDG
jgi:hypothetical protein